MIGAAARFAEGDAAYLNAAEDAFRSNTDYAMLVKRYGWDSDETSPGKRYSSGVSSDARNGPPPESPTRSIVSTSYVESQNLTMRMHVRRFTRLTNPFSKEVENPLLSSRLYFFHKTSSAPITLRVTPAMDTGIINGPLELVQREMESGSSLFAGLQPCRRASLDATAQCNRGACVY